MKTEACVPYGAETVIIEGKLYWIDALGRAVVDAVSGDVIGHLMPMAPVIRRRQ